MDCLRNIALSTVVYAVARHLGYPLLKPSQLRAIMAFCLGNDVFMPLPTGFGKTLIYTILPVLFDLLKSVKSSIVVVVSPLAALMAEQKRKFIPMGINAEFLGELQLDGAAVQHVTQGFHSLVLVSPENLLYNSVLQDMLLTKVYQDNLVAFVVDEAHCIKTW